MSAYRDVEDYMRAMAFLERHRNDTITVRTSDGRPVFAHTTQPDCLWTGSKVWYPGCDDPTTRAEFFDPPTEETRKALMRTHRDDVMRDAGAWIGNKPLPDELVGERAPEAETSKEEENK